MTIPFSLRPSPEWFRITVFGKDHLRKDQRDAWCGVSAHGSHVVAGGESARCRSCLRVLHEYAASALTPPPETVTERVVITVTRKAGSENLLSVLGRNLRSHTSWTWTVEEDCPEAVLDN